MKDATELRRALRVIGAAARAKDAPEIRESDRRALREWLRVVAAMAKGGKSRRNPAVCVDSPLAADAPLELKAASLRFASTGRAKAPAPTRSAKPGKRQKVMRARRTRTKRAAAPLLAAIKQRGGINRAEALRLWGAAYVEGAPRGVFTRKGRGVDRMAIDLGADNWWRAALGEDQVGEMAERIRAELFGAASPHPQQAPSIADMEIDELVAAARSGDASAQEELGLRGIAWNPSRRRNPDLLTMAGNPGSAAMAKAAAAYRQFHGCAPQKIRRIGKGAGVLVALGDLLEIVYKAKRGDRRGAAWWHKFGKGSVLASTPDGKHLFILNPKGTRTAVDWQRGIVS